MADVDEALRVLRGDVGDHAHAKAKPLQAHKGPVRTTDWAPWFTGSTGISYETKTDELTGDMIIRACQDVYQILELNQAMFVENSGYTPDKSMRRVASIPTLLRNKIMAEEGWDPWQPGKYPERYKRLMNDIDYSKLRTAKGRI